MFISKKALSRRTLLKGVGAVIALPMLDAMTPAMSAVPVAPKRLGFTYIPNGMMIPYWTPSTTGANFEFSPTLKPLEPYKSNLTVVGNLLRAGTTIGDHAVSAAGWMTSVYAKMTEAEDVLAGTTIDQVIAKAIGQDTVFPSLELATEDFTGYIGACIPGFSCAYMNTLCWSSPTTPLPMEINPRVAFERMFGRAGSAEQRRVRMSEDRSIIDSITGDAKRLGMKVGASDRGRIDEYLEQLREIERRIQRMEVAKNSQAVVMDAPLGIPDNFEEHVAVMFELMRTAYQADLTRVVTFMMSREASQRTYPQIGLNEPHHTVSHHGGDKVKIALLAKLNNYHVQQFAKFVEKMKNTPDGDGSLLDHSLMICGCGMGDSNGHATDPLPWVGVGGMAGQGNRHLVPSQKTLVGNLWVGVAQKFGVNVDHIGVSNGILEI
ncbi:MAG TPA: DUF1552 domain-containing protein [Steroidobacteraceae bacterium]|jgi:hypothetical protein